MNFEQHLIENGYRDLGPCGCQGMKGNDYQHPEKAWLVLRVFKKQGLLRIREYGVTEATLQLDERNLVDTINRYK